MPYGVNLETGFFTKTLELIDQEGGPEATLMLLELRLLSAAAGTDGVIRKSMLRAVTTTFDPMLGMKTLVEANLATETEDGWEIDWSEQKSNEDQQEYKRRNRQRARHGRGDHSMCPDTWTCRRSTPVTPGGNNRGKRQPKVSKQVSNEVELLGLITPAARCARAAALGGLHPRARREDPDEMLDHFVLDDLLIVSVDPGTGRVWGEKGLDARFELIGKGDTRSNKIVLRREVAKLKKHLPRVFSEVHGDWEIIDDPESGIGVVVCFNNVECYENKIEILHDELVKFVQEFAHNEDLNSAYEHNV